MKIGFSFGRCLRSLVLGEVMMDDVLCIIARTYMLTEDHVLDVIAEYRLRSDYLYGLDPTTCETIGLELFRTGKIIEPRSNGVHAMSVPRDYVWMDLFPTIVDVRSDAVRNAWEQYRTLIQLTEQLPEGDFAPAHYKPPTSESTEADLDALEKLAQSI